MNQTKHTPESEWEVIESEYYCTIRVGKVYMQAPYQPPHGRGHCPRQIADAHRVVNSVKACKGMADPEKEIGELRRRRDELHAVVAANYVLMEWLYTQDDDTGYLPTVIADWLIDLWPEFVKISCPMKYTQAVDRVYDKYAKLIGMRSGQFSETSIREALETITAIKNAGGGQ